MISPRRLSFALAILVAVSACSDDDGGNGTEPTPLAALVGSWTTQSFTYTSVANPGLSVDLATSGAGITSLTVNADGSFTGSASVPLEGQEGLVPIDASGTLTNVTSTSLTINFVGTAALVLTNPLPVAYTLSGNVLSFIATDLDIDFSSLNPALPPGEQPVTLDVVLLRN